MKNSKLKKYSDRDLLELILSTQVLITQRLFRMNDFFCHHYGEEYINSIQHKGPVFKKMIEEQRDFLSQLVTDAD